MPRFPAPEEIVFLDVETGGALKKSHAQAFDFARFFRESQRADWIDTPAAVFHANHPLLQIYATQIPHFQPEDFSTAPLSSFIKPPARPWVVERGERVAQPIGAWAQEHHLVSPDAVQTEEEALGHFFGGVEARIAGHGKAYLGGWNVGYDIGAIERAVRRHASLERYHGFLGRMHAAGKLDVVSAEESLMQTALDYGRSSPDFAGKYLRTSSGRVAETLEDMRQVPGYRLGHVMRGHGMEALGVSEESLHTAYHDTRLAAQAYEDWHAVRAHLEAGATFDEAFGQVWQGATAHSVLSRIYDNPRLESRLADTAARGAAMGAEGAPAAKALEFAEVHWRRLGLAAAGAAAAGLALRLAFGKRRERQTQIVGLSDDGLAVESRHALTPFGSGWRGLEEDSGFNWQYAAFLGAGYGAYRGLSRWAPQSFHRHLSGFLENRGFHLWKGFGKALSLSHIQAGYLPQELQFAGSQIVDEAGNLTSLGSHFERLFGSGLDLRRHAVEHGGLRFERGSPWSPYLSLKGTSYEARFVGVPQHPGWVEGAADGPARFRGSRWSGASSRWGAPPHLDTAPAAVRSGSSWQRWRQAFHQRVRGLKPFDPAFIGSRKAGVLYGAESGGMLFQPLFARQVGARWEGFKQAAGIFSLEMLERPQRLLAKVGLGVPAGTWSSASGLAAKLLTRVALPAAAGALALDYADYRSGHRLFGAVAGVIPKARIAHAELTDRVPGARKATDWYAEHVPGPWYGPAMLPLIGWGLGKSLAGLASSRVFTIDRPAFLQAAGRDASTFWKALGQPSAGAALKTAAKTSAVRGLWEKAASANPAQFKNWGKYGLAAGLAAMAPFLPGMLGSRQTAHQLRETYSGREPVAVRSGRWWSLGNTRLAGRRIVAHRPSWYARLLTRPERVNLWGSEKEYWAHHPILHPLRWLKDPYALERCVIEGTSILLSDGSIKEIQEIKRGDRVLTSTSEPSRVQEVWSEHIDEDVITVTSALWASFPTTTTPEHRYLAVRTVPCHRRYGRKAVCVPHKSWIKCAGCSSPCDQYAPEWVRADELKPGDYLVFPRPRIKHCLGQHLPLPRPRKWWTGKGFTTGTQIALPTDVAPSPELFRLIGYYLSEGHASSNEIQFSFASDETAYINDTVQLVKTLFGLRCSISNTKPTVTQVKVCNTRLASWFRLMCRSGAHSKRIAKTLLHANRGQLEQLIVGFFRGDGTEFRGDVSISCNTVSKQLAHQLKHILLMLGITPCLRIDKASGPRKPSDTFVIDVHGQQANALRKLIGWEVYREAEPTRWYWEEDGYIYVKIKSVERVRYSGQIYDLKIEDNFSFLTVGATLHNTRYRDRPYPMTSPAGSNIPLIGPLVAATVGRILKPPRRMHQEEWSGENYFLSNPRVEPRGPQALAPAAPREEYRSFPEVVRRESEIAAELVGLPGWGLKTVWHRLFADKKSGQRVFFQGSRQMSSWGRKYSEQEAGSAMGPLGDLSEMESYSEPLRRFVQKDIKTNQANQIPNRMPSWLPGEDYMVDFKHGDPYVKLPSGASRLPGPAYELLHPELKGVPYEDYSALERYRIVADVAPWSNQLRGLESRLEAETRNDTAQRIEYEKIRERAERVRASSEDFDERRYSAPVETIEGTVKSATPAGLELAELPGRRFSLSALGVRAADLSSVVLGEKNALTKAQVAREVESRHQQLSSHLAGLVGEKVRLVAPEGSRAHASDARAVVFAGGRNINQELLDRGLALKRADQAGAEFQAMSSPAGKALGRLAEATAFEGDIAALNPMHWVASEKHSKLWQERTALEQYKHHEVYGARIQRWEKPIKSFLAPWKRGLVYRATGKAAPSSTVSERRDLDTLTDYLEYLRGISSGKHPRTAVGADVLGDPGFLRGTLAGRDKFYFAAFRGETSDRQRQKILAAVPSDFGRILQGQWVRGDIALARGEGRPVPEVTEGGRLKTKDAYASFEEARGEGQTKLNFGDWERSKEIAQFFFRRDIRLPDSPDSAVFDENIDYEDVKLKILQEEGLDAHDFNIFEDRAAVLWRKPYVDGAVRELTSGDDRTPEQLRRAIEQMILDRPKVSAKDAKDPANRVVVSSRASHRDRTEIRVTVDEDHDDAILEDVRRHKEDYEPVEAEA